MSTYVSNRNSDGYTDENGHFRFPMKLVDGEVLEGFDVTTESTNMILTIAPGEAKIPYQDYAYAVWSDSPVDVEIDTASAINPRMDEIVAYVDRNMSFTPDDTNNQGALKFKVVKGTPSVAPVPPSDSVIDDAVTAGNPWIPIAKVLVPMGATQIVTNNIDTSIQKHVSMSQNVKMPEIAAIDGSSIKFAVIKDGDPLPSAITGSTLVVLVVKDE